jgi:arsenate reductase
VITVCDEARQVCPVFPGEKQTVLHWGYEDPAKVEGTEQQRLEAFQKTLTMMATRIAQFVTLARREREQPLMSDTARA